MKSYTILIVEDNPTNRKILVDLLGVQGYATIVAEDGLAGVEMAISNKPDLILMDVQLPKMDGYEATRRIRAETSTKDIPIVIVTSFAMKGEEQTALAEGASAYVSKPIDIHKLMETVKKFLP